MPRNDYAFGVSLSQKICTVRPLISLFSTTTYNLILNFSGFSSAFDTPCTAVPWHEPQSKVKKQPSEDRDEWHWKTDALGVCVYVCGLPNASNLPKPVRIHIQSWPWARQTLTQQHKKLPSQQHNDDLRCVCFSYGYDFVCEKERKISLKHCNKHFSFLTHSDQTTSGNCALHERAATNNSIFLLKKASWTITTPHYTCQFHRKSCSLLLRSVVLLALSDVVSNV